MKKILFFLFGTFIIINAQKKITLDEAVAIALQSNTSLLKTKNSLISSKSSLKSAYGALLPSLDASVNYNWNKTMGQYDLPSNDSYGSNIGASWLLFDGLSNIYNVLQKDNDFESAEFALEKLKQDVVFEATSLYYAVINAEKLLKVREENVKYNQKFLETIQERNRLGSVAIADVYTQQVQAGNAELLFIQAQNNLENAKSSLLNYLSLDVLDEYTFEDVEVTNSGKESEAYIDEFGSITNMVKNALDNRKDYQSKQLDLESAEDGVVIARGGLFPKLSASYTISSTQLSRIEKVDSLTSNRFFLYNNIPTESLSDLYKSTNHTFGLTLSIPIFSNWRTDNQIQLAQVSVMNSQEDLSALERSIKIQVKQGYLDLQAAKKQLDVSNKNVISAGENRRVNNERYNLGSGTILDVLQADKDYQQALSDQINAQYRYFEYRDRLMNYLGVLDYKKFE